MKIVRKKKIFLVEDETMFASLLRDYLQTHTGHEVILFNTGEACLNELDENPDIIILDYFLNSDNPEAADGLQILRKIRSRGSRAHIIMLSGQSEFGVAMQSRMDGAKQYVIKDDQAFERITRLIMDHK